MSQKLDDEQRPRAHVVYKLMENLIEGYQLKIKALAEELPEGWVDESIAIYDKAVEQARNRISPEKFAALLFDYARFLHSRFSRVDMLYDYDNFSLRSDGEDCLAKCRLAGHLLDECLGIYRQLAEECPDAYLSKVALTLNEMGGLHFDMHQFDEAEREWTEALDIYRRLENLTGVFLTLNALEVMHQHSRDHGLGSHKSLDINMTEKNPHKLQALYADVLIALAGLHKKHHCYDKAESNYAEALKKYCLLVMTDATTFQPHVASTLSSLAFLHAESHRFEEAEREYARSIEIRRQLAAKNSKSIPILAVSLKFYGDFYSKKGQYVQARKYWNEALEILQEISRETLVFDSVRRLIVKLLEETKDK